MKQKTVSVTIIILFLFFCCVSFQKEQISKYDHIEFEKSGCLGNCSAYKISIDRKGNAAYEGITNVSFVGNFFCKLSRKENKSLWRLIYSAKPDTMKEEYDYGAEDSQQRFLRCYSGDKVKEVRFGNNVPDILKKIEADIKKIISGNAWKKSLK